YILIFFSSRRQHTISKRDWSSDVCSSDLRSLFLHCYLSNGVSYLGDYIFSWWNAGGGYSRPTWPKHGYCTLRIFYRSTYTTCKKRNKIWIDCNYRNAYQYCIKTFYKWCVGNCLR